jgi:predicted dehydrogenase
MGIGLVGLGGITQAHRSGYHLFGLPVVAGCDPDEDARQRFRAGEPDAGVYGTLDEFLADERVEVVDLATPHRRETRVPQVERIAAAGKPVYIQKPLGFTYADALEMVGLVERAGVPGMVNQNMCFAPGALTLARQVVDERVIGDPFYAEIHLRLWFDTPLEHWYGKEQRWWTIGCTVHQLAVIHQVLGPPETVYAIAGTDPKQPGVTHDGFGNMLLRYANGRSAAILSTGAYYGQNQTTWLGERSYFQGPDGVIDWHVEEPYALIKRADTQPGGSRVDASVAVEGAWFPDAFGLAMDHFQYCVQHRQTPLCSVQDNLYVMATCEAVYRSSAENRVVPLAEIMGDRYDPDYGPGWRRGAADWPRPTAGSTERKG